MTTIQVALDDSQLARFRGPAELLGVAPEEVARLSIQEFLARPDDEFDAIVEEIVAERGELLRRLAR